MRRGLATEVLGFVLLLAAGLLGSVALFAFALGLLAVVAGCLAVTSVGARRVVVGRTVDQAGCHSVDRRDRVRSLRCHA